MCDVLRAHSEQVDWPIQNAEQSAEKNDGISAMDPIKISDVSGLSPAIKIGS